MMIRGRTFTCACRLMSSARAAAAAAAAAPELRPTLTGLPGSEHSESVLAETKEDISDQLQNAFPSFGFAPFVNKSETLRNFLDLGVNLHKIERDPKHTEFILGLDFEKDVKPHLRFLGDYVRPDRLGSHITTFPMIFDIDLDDLRVRIDYLRSKNFKKDDIDRIVTANPLWLGHSTSRIDARLGTFQKTFRLSGDEVRYLTTKRPSLITHDMHRVKMNTFTVKEEFGFTSPQMKSLLLKKPSIWMIDNPTLVRRFNNLHDYMKISHRALLETPGLLLCRDFKIKQRNEFLKKIKKDQYDPRKPNYVPLIKLAEGSDSEFCADVAGCSVHDFNLFLKTV